MPDPASLQLGLLFAAFWAAIFAFRARDRQDAVAFIVGLMWAALAAHLAWCGLRWDLVRAQPSLLLNPSAGFTVLATPLGIIGASWCSPQPSRSDFLGRGLSALAIGLCIAKLGCAALGCCGAIALPHDDGITDRALQLTEAVGFLALWLALSFGPSAARVAVFFAAMGGMRLAAEMFRAPHGTPAEATVALWASLTLVGLGCALALAQLPRFSWAADR